MTPMALPREIERALARRRRAQARRLLHRRARPLPHRPARSRRCCAGSTTCRGGAVALARHLFRRERRALAVAGELGDRAAAPVRRTRQCWCAAGSRRAAAYRQAARRYRLFPLGQGGLAHAAPRRRLPQRSRQGAELALGTTAPRISSISSSRPASVAAARLFRIAAYEDLRHLLKHKRRYAPEALTATEHRVLARKSVLTRDVDGNRQEGLLLRSRAASAYTDREGGGPRLVHDAPAHRRASQDASRGCATSAIVAFPDRRAGTGLYAFVEGSAGDRGSTARLHRRRASASQRTELGASPRASPGGRGVAARRAGRGTQRNPRSSSP